MRQEEQQVNSEHPEAFRSSPVPVPGNRSGWTEVPEDALDDRGTFDDPRVAGDLPWPGTRDRAEDRNRNRAEAGDRADRDRADAEAADPDRDRADAEAADRDRDRAEAGERTGFNDPAPLPTAFGATTVGAAVAASALASPRAEDEPDPREEWTAQPGDGEAEGERVGPEADPRAELHRRDDQGAGSADADRESRPAGTEGTAARGGGLIVPPDATEGAPERRADLTGWAGDPEAGRAGYGSPTPAMADPDAVSPDADPVLAGAAGAAAGSLQAAGTNRPAGSTVADEPATLFDTATAQGFRDRWREVQLRFVDDPRAAAGDAQSLVDEALAALTQALSAQKSKLSAWQEAGSADTEQLRMAVRHYRDFLDRVLGR